MSRQRISNSYLVFIAAMGLVLGGAECPGTGDEDGGPAPIECEEGGEQSVAPGETGIRYVAIDDGGDLASWPRPQGGIGTRLNVRIGGFDEEKNFSTLTIYMTKNISNPSETAGEEGGPCIDDGSSEPTCTEPVGNAPELSCIDGTCMLLVAEQVNRQFPMECQSDGSLLVPEMPVRYRSQLSLDDVDGIEVNLKVTLSPSEDEETIESAPVNVVLRVGDFIAPSWWETD